MTATLEATITFRKTKRGEWVAFGPASIVKAGETVTITKKNGSTTDKYVYSVGKEFTVNGEPMVYGYLNEMSDSEFTDWKLNTSGYGSPLEGYCY